MRVRYVIGVVAVLIVVGIILLQSRGIPLLQYLFFCRVPLVLGLLVVALPWIACGPLRSLLRSLFVLRSSGQILLVTCGALFTSFMVMLTARTIVLLANKRLAKRLGEDGFDVVEQLASEIYPVWWWLLLVLALPIIIISVKLSVDLKLGRRLLGAVQGTLLAALILLLYPILVEWEIIERFLIALLNKMNSVTGGAVNEGYFRVPGQEVYEGHIASTGFLLVLAVLYVIGYHLFKPKPDLNRRRPPTLYYLLFMMTIGGFLMAGATFLLDRYRVPAVLVTVALSALIYTLFKVDHYYRLFDADKPPAGSISRRLQGALKARLELQPDNGKTIVVVCASGGGIQAAGWTTQVLAGLQERYGPEFTKAVCLISSVSGGSVGTMHYLDHFNHKEGYPPAEELGKLVDDSVAESLDATGWGLAGPDFLRVIGLPWLVDRMTDRGWAIEQAWKANLQHPDASYSTWRKIIASGGMPIPVFNSTVVENGNRLLLAPLPMVGDGGLHRDETVDFFTLYPKKDIEAVTAARLSATFPYVTPVCRTNLDNEVLFAGRHVADGGYFDNFGVFTAIEWLEKVALANLTDSGVKRVLFLEINAFPKGEKDEGRTPENGWLQSIAGPLLAILNVRTSTQVARNAADVRGLVERWQGKVHIEPATVRFELDERGLSEFLGTSGEYEPPLSWKLTEPQKEAIRRAWRQMVEKPSLSIRQIDRFWQQSQPEVK
jgi:hypothetical protein